MRSLLRRLVPEKPLLPASIDIGGMAVPVAFRRHARARRLIVRLAAKGHGIAVTLPPRASRAEALDFVARSRDWIEARLAKRPQAVALAPGATVPLRGVVHEVRLMPARRGTVTIDPDGPALTVPGDAAHAPRRLRDWLMAEARRDLAEASRRYAPAMGARLKRIAVRDQKSRWGSCSADGVLSYSWRLILAPPFVLDYVAAHEAAHLVHMNHGPKFWRLVLGHCPAAAKARDWLKRHGADLHRYGG